MRVAPLSVQVAVFATIALAAAAGAQNYPRAFIRVTARDSSGSPVQSADLTVTRGLRDVVARGTTDDAGQSLLSVEVKDSTEFQLAMRKIGYARGDRVFAVGPRDTVRVTITVARPTAQLATVRVTAEADLKRKSYHLDADDIEKADMPLDNGWEIVKRLRPDMLTSRGGCATGVQEVWVNGKRMRLPLLPTGMVLARARVGVPPRARFSAAAVSIMSEILPEHIQEINYHDCFDHSMAAVGNNDAIFVVLKPGVTYQMNVGTFVLDEPATRARP